MPAADRPTPHPPSPRRPRAAVTPPAQDAPLSSAPFWTDGRRTALLFALVFVPAALLYWPAFEAKRNLPDALYGPALALPALLAMADAWFGRRPFARAVWLGAAVLPAAVFARVVYDGLRDPTSHNLWPFELAIAFGVALPPAVAGALAGWLLLRLAGRRAGR